MNRNSLEFYKSHPIEFIEKFNQSITVVYNENR